MVKLILSFMAIVITLLCASSLFLKYNTNNKNHSFLRDKNVIIYKKDFFKTKQKEEKWNK